MDRPAARAALVALLRMAYSGERAAAHAYRGHAASVGDPEERRRIREIEAEEWRHRDLVGGMLAGLGSGPDPRRERRALRIGRFLDFASRVTPYLFPMLGAGFLESRNVKEYDDAAEHAVAAGHPEYVDCLREMADVEREHERFFRGRVESHWLGSVLPLWAAPPPRPKRAVGSVGRVLEGSVP